MSPAQPEPAVFDDAELSLGRFGVSQAIAQFTLCDPANHRNGRMDVAVIGTRIARVGTNLRPAQARDVIDAADYYVTPGLIAASKALNKGIAWAAGARC